MISQLIRGLWQLAKGHQTRSSADFHLDPILDSISCGMTTFDCADIYTGVEELLGEAKTRCGDNSIRVHTKYVPDLSQLSQLTFAYTSRIIERSLKRLKTDCVDLVQFHWWDYSQPHYLEALDHLHRLKAEGKIKKIGLTNFDTPHLREVLRAGFEVESIQLQASLIDKRAQCEMKTLCQENGIKRLAYGTLLGGFLNEKWLGVDEPALDFLENRSLIKYKLLIDEWGGWERFQNFLKVLSTLSHKYHTSLSQIAVLGVLQGDLADSAIVGLSPTGYYKQNRELQRKIEIENQDLQELLAWHSPLPGDVYELERLPKHGAIMKYNLNG